MSEHPKRSNPLLIIITVFLCICAGIFFVRPGTKAIQEESSQVISETKEQSETATGSDTAEEPSETPAPQEEKQISESSSADNTEAPSVSDVASSGTWTSSGSNWTFVVNGSPYTGWLTDTDGKTYYFNSEGIMQTGWVEDNGKRYYMDLDGIMQKDRIITADGKSYQLNKDGSVREAGSDSSSENTSGSDEQAASEPTAAPTAEHTQAPTAEPTKEPTPEPTATPTPEPTAAAPEVTAAPADASPMYAALTFDDGPGENTSRVLDILEQNGAKATFFMVGTSIEGNSELVSRMESLGCELGNHSYDNLDLTTMDYQSIKDQFDGVNELLNTIVGHGATVARVPYSAVNDDVAAAAYLPIVEWTLDSGDSSTSDAQQIVDTVLSQVTDGSVILLHDLNSQTADALTQLMPDLIKGGYQLVTVSELASVKGVELQNGVTYTSITNQG